MTKEERDDLLSKIEEALTGTEKEILRLEEITQPIAPENAIGRISRMDAINNKSVAEATLRSAKRKAASLKRARAKIDDPNFGKCNRCGKGIPIARLMYMPQSPYCVHCADKS